IGFKPRFKAASAKPATEGSPKAVDITEEPHKHSPPTGFKPRFKAGATYPATPSQSNPPDSSNESNTETPAPEGTPKPLGFKPRFKAGNTPPAKGDDPSVAKPTANKDTADTAEGTDTPAKPLGF